MKYTTTTKMKLYHFISVKKNHCTPKINCKLQQKQLVQLTTTTSTQTTNNIKKN